MTLNDDSQEEEEAEAEDLFALEQPKVAKQLTAVEYVQEDYYKESTT
jgi:hypothetical protein